MASDVQGSADDNYERRGSRFLQNMVIF